MNAEKKRIHIILPNRIGDSILALPSLICLKRLVDKYHKGCFDITVLTHFPLVRLFQSLNLFEFKEYNGSARVASWLERPDRAYFLATTSKNIGYYAKTRYGLRHKQKKLVRYDVDLPYLSPAPLGPEATDELFRHIQAHSALPEYAIKHFGICREFGFSNEQIMAEFSFDGSSILAGREDGFGDPSTGADYVVCCMEAAYNKKRNAYRRWGEENFLVLAEKLHAEYGIDTVFIGLNRHPQIEAKHYFKDMRGKLNLDQIVHLLERSRGYIGNDTGPLHLANLLRKKSIGIYAADGAIAYRPLFPELNVALLNTQPPEEIYPSIQFLVSEERSSVPRHDHAMATGRET
jgi:ADP-heptose:LPS heptosyltransferase